jgi:asparagine synthetase B (glutamine-hydrolysing)
MCGIAGILTTHESLALRPALLVMARALRHRGPDAPRAVAPTE